MTTTPNTITLTGSDSNIVDENSAAFIGQILARLDADGIDIGPMVVELTGRGVVLDGVEVVDYPYGWTGLASTDMVIDFADAAGYAVELP